MSNQPTKTTRLPQDNYYDWKISVTGDKPGMVYQVWVAGSRIDNVALRVLNHPNQAAISLDETALDDLITILTGYRDGLI